MLMINENGLHSCIGATSASIGVILTQQGKFREARQILREAKHHFTLFLDDKDPKPSLEIIREFSGLKRARHVSVYLLLEECLYLYCCLVLELVSENTAAVLLIINVINVTMSFSYCISPYHHHQR